ncbi:hypothetical protein NDU88_005055 [Pleurodeles waltl]|uniref:Uncharacterized protein n=1 Tax=Pleurodeles waltl TaxID=8319 RepID=A0AAV7MY43_PLEWA|nr:hypothetical protein NDU88_005055 [Pleurodeles waltl]
MFKTSSVFHERRGDTSLRLRVSLVPLSALLAHNTKLLTSRGLRARVSHCQGEETHRYGYQLLAHVARRAKLSEEPLKGSRAKEEKKKTFFGEKTDPQTDITSAGYKMALYYSSASQQECQYAKAPVRQGAASSQYLLQALPGLHHSGSPIPKSSSQESQISRTRSGVTGDVSGRKFVGSGLVVTPRRQC